jgi:hypothetical protein
VDSDMDGAAFLRTARNLVRDAEEMAECRRLLMDLAGCNMLLLEDPEKFDLDSTKVRRTRGALDRAMEYLRRPRS